MNDPIQPPSTARTGARPGGRSGARSARRRSRELAMQGLYQWLLSGESGRAIQAHIENSPGFDRADRAPAGRREEWIDASVHP